MTADASALVIPPRFWRWLSGVQVIWERHATLVPWILLANVRMLIQEHKDGTVSKTVDLGLA